MPPDLGIDSPPTQTVRELIDGAGSGRDPKIAKACVIAHSHTSPAGAILWSNLATFKQAGFQFEVVLTDISPRQLGTAIAAFDEVLGSGSAWHGIRVAFGRRLTKRPPSEMFDVCGLPISIAAGATDIDKLHTEPASAASREARLLAFELARAHSQVSTDCLQKSIPWWKAFRPAPNRLRPGPLGWEAI